jgi:hypothetical protein
MTKVPRSKEALIKEILQEEYQEEGFLDDLLARIMMIVDSRNLVVRENNKQGIPILSMIREDLDAARESWKAESDGAKKARIRGRMAGLAQALATVQSPYTRLHGSKTEWGDYVKKVMEGKDGL